jgi:sec-independent protein translocase protein TatA
MFPAIGMPEMLVIMLVVLLLFGSKRLPDLAKGIGKSMKEFKKAAEDVKREIDI